uniref:Acid-sensing ion channel 1 n=1 Tax=Caenorhabditis tropicalis TaxID=1561998 RepID=A0A1I7UQ12_9PELO
MLEKQARSTIRRTRFDEASCVMYMNGNRPETTVVRSHSLTQSQSLSDSAESAIRKTSTRSHEPTDVSSLSDSSDDNDDSLYLLRETSTLHGLRDVMLSSSGRLRMVWVLIVISALFMTFQGCYQIMDEYSMRRIVVSYFIQEADSIWVPDVVVCPYNRFNRSFFEANNVSFELAQFLELSFPSIELPFENLLLKTEEIIKKIDTLDFQLEALLNQKNMSYVQFLRNASLNCEAFFQDESRCANITEMMTSAGKCFRLAGVKQEASGFGNGDRYIIDLPEEYYNPGINQMINSGVIIKLAERGQGIDNDLTFLPAGVHAIMPLLGTQFEFMNDPPRYECEEDPHRNYSRVHCYEDCLTSDAQKFCQCSPAAAHNPGHPDRICTATLLYHCFFPNLFTDDGKVPKAKVDACKKKCKAPCHAWNYNKQISYSNIPSESSRALIPKEEYNKMKRRIILDIYYSQLDYTIIKHVIAMPLSSLIAQIGGQFSLWAGGSLISLCQIVIYSVRYVLHKFCGLKSQKKRPRETREDQEARHRRERRRQRRESPSSNSRSTPKPHNGNGNGKIVNMEMVTTRTTETTPPI